MCLTPTHTSFVVRRSSFVVRRSSSVVRRSSFVVRRSSFAVVGQQPTTTVESANAECAGNTAPPSHEAHGCPLTSGVNISSRCLQDAINVVDGGTITGCRALRMYVLWRVLCGGRPSNSVVIGRIKRYGRCVHVGGHLTTEVACGVSVDAK